MTRHLSAIKGRMVECGYTQESRARSIERSRAYVAARMTGKATFDLRDAYAICAILGLPAECLAQYFPAADCYQPVRTKMKTR